MVPISWAKIWSKSSYIGSSTLPFLVQTFRHKYFSIFQDLICDPALGTRGLQVCISSKILRTQNRGVHLVSLGSPKNWPRCPMYGGNEAFIVHGGTSNTTSNVRIVVNRLVLGAGFRSAFRGGGGVSLSFCKQKADTPSENGQGIFFPTCKDCVNNCQQMCK